MSLLRSYVARSQPAITLVLPLCVRACVWASMHIEVIPPKCCVYGNLGRDQLGRVWTTWRGGSMSVFSQHPCCAFGARFPSNQICGHTCMYVCIGVASHLMIYSHAYCKYSAQYSAQGSLMLPFIVTLYSDEWRSPNIVK